YMRAAIALSITVAILTTFGGEASAETCKAAAYPIVQPDGYQHDRWVSGQESGDLRFEFGGFVSVLDGLDDDDGNPSTPNVHFQPEWVAQEVHRYVEGGMFVYADGFERPSNWYEFSKFPDTPKQAGVTDLALDVSYDGEGTMWNRGHMPTPNPLHRITPQPSRNSPPLPN